MANIENNNWVGGKKDVQIATKLTGLIGGVIILSCFIIAFASIFVFGRRQLKTTEDLIEHTAQGAQRVMVDWSVTLNGYAAISASRSDVVEAFLNGDMDALQSFAREYDEVLDYEYMAFVDTNGVVLAGGADGFSKGTNLSFSYAVKKALMGTSASSYEPISPAPYGVVYAYPVKNGNQTIGAAVFVYDLTTEDFITLMQSAYDVECTIFSNDVRVRSTIPGVEGTTLDNKSVVSTVLSSGNTFKGVNKIKGDDYYSIYTPLTNDDGTVTGMLFIAKSLKSIEAIKYATMRVVILIAVILVIVLMVASSFFIRWLMWRIGNVAKQLEEMASGEAERLKLAVGQKFKRA